MSDHILLNADNATVSRGLSDELDATFVLAEPAAGCGSFDVHIEEQQRTVQVAGGWGSAVLESVPRTVVLHLHVYVHCHDVIVCYLIDSKKL